jgi:uncharacterized repeat protein (TIGR01451 family)
MPARKIFLAASLVAGMLLVPGIAPAQTSGADLSVDKSDAPDPATVGSPLTYTVTVDNDGPEAATDVQMEDVLPQSVSFVSATPTQGSCSQVLLVVTCALGGLADEASASIVILVTPSGSGSLNNIAAVESSTPDPNPLNNLVTEATTVGGGSGPGTDLAVQKADAPDPVAPGSNLTYVVTVANAGGSAAGGVKLTDVLPLTASVVSVTASSGSCTGPTLVVLTCDLGSMAAGGSATVTVVARFTTEGSVANTAAVASTTEDTNPANNLVTEASTVSASAGGGGGGGGGAGGGSGGGGGGGGGQGLAACTIRGTSLNDTLSGTQGDDIICGLEGDDVIKGMGGKDVLIGGPGNDRGNGGKDNDTVKGQAGKDRLRGAQKNDRLAGGDESDRLNGGPGKDRLNGGKGKDRCKKGKGDKTRGCP